MNQDQSAPDPPDSLDQRYACMTCSTTFRLGKVIVSQVSETRPLGLGCPNCGDGLGLHPAGGETVALTEYYGKRGTVQ